MTQIFDLLKDVINFGFMFSTSCFQVYSVQCSMNTSPSQGVLSSTAAGNLLQSDIIRKSQYKVDKEVKNMIRHIQNIRKHTTKSNTR